MAQIKQFLVSHNIPQIDVDEAIIQFNNMQGTQYAQAGYTQGAQSYVDQGTESQIRNYMQAQMNNGYGIEAIKNALVRQGFNPGMVNKVASDLGSVNINVKHEVNFSKGTVIGILSVILILGLVTYGIFNFSMFKPEESLMDITVSTNIYSYIAGENVNYQVFVTNMGSIQRFDATIKSLIVDDAGNIITRKEETVAIETTSSINRNIQLPLNMKPGKYYLQIISDYDGKQAQSKAEFEVVLKDSDKKPSTYVPPANTSSAKNDSGKTGNNASGQANNNINDNNNNNNRPNANIPSATSGASTGAVFGDVINNVRSTAQNNPESAASICSKLTSEEQKDVCYEVVADSSQAASYCERVGDITRRDNCYLAFVMKGNLEVCDKITDTNDKQFCEQLRIVQLMNKYYAENNTEKIKELSKEFNPDLFSNTPQVQTYEHTYTETAYVNVLDVMSTDSEGASEAEGTGTDADITTEDPSGMN